MIIRHHHWKEPSLLPAHKVYPTDITPGITSVIESPIFFTYLPYKYLASRAGRATRILNQTLM